MDDIEILKEYLESDEKIIHGGDPELDEIFDNIFRHLAKNIVDGKKRYFSHR